MHPHRKEYPEDLYWHLLRGVQARFWDWRHQLIVVTVDDNGKTRIAGAADWRRIGGGGKKMELAWIDPRNLIAPSISIYHKVSLKLFPNRAADPAQASILNVALANAASYWTGEHAECWDLYVCGVHPDFQGKALGRCWWAGGLKKRIKN